MHYILICLVFFLSAISSSFAEDAMHLPVDKFPLVIQTNKGKVHFNAEIAHTSEQKQRGLMYRQDFPADRAMLFTFGQEQVISMWMLDTPLPLDMIFLNNAGYIVSIYMGARPYSPAIISSVYPAAFVIELNEGQAETQGIAIGQRVVHPAICGECGE